MKHERTNRFDRLLQIRAPEFLTDAAAFVVRVNLHMTAEDRASVANARGRVAVLPYKCATTEEWSARYAMMGTLQ